MGAVTQPGPLATKTEVPAFFRVEQEVSLLLRRSRSYLAGVAREVHPDLDASAYPLLLYIGTREEVRAADLAEYFGMNKGPISRQLTSLERLGLIRRVVDPADGRAALLVPTAEGRERFESARRARIERMSRQLDQWEDGDVERFATLLARFNELLV